MPALWVTVKATVCGTLLAVTLGLLWAVLRRSHFLAVARPVSFAVEFIRSTPLIVQIYFLFYVFPAYGLTLGAFTTGVLALGLHYSAYMAEVYRAGIEGVPKGQWEAATALNLTRYQRYRLVVLPQAIPPVVPALGNYLVAMFKDTPQLSAITVLEMLQTAKIIGSETFRYLEPLTLVGALFLVLSLCASAGVRKLEAILRL
ncbi:MAG: ectoine/hydroxyectoine ABC transporter permease subunit EhuD, partial [FCB group bacterium]|nr:ectoine/hydroxyectoine ABC transporter permease subunit EhuD [FCB group bacterium]